MFAQILWVCLWCNLDSGFWNIVPPQDFSGWQLYIRAVLPFAVLPSAGFILLYKRRLRLPRRSPSRLLMIYGCFAAFATIFSPEPMWSLYWSVTFLASILAAWTFIDRAEPMKSARQLLQITWMASFTVAAIIAYQARNSVFGDAPSGYDVHVELDWLSRASGVARWAAVPGLVCLVRAYYTRRVSLMAFYLGIAAVSFFIVYRMQSRGAIFGSVAALLFALLVSTKMRRYALPFAALALTFILILDSPSTVSNRVATYLQRGETREEFLSMTGRTRAYKHGLTVIQEHPVFGQGQWADRLTIGEHVHNSFLQALLNAGILGGIPYLGSWIAGWILFYKLQKRSNRLSPDDRIHVLECGTVMMFFTVRAIPETTTASFAVDLLVMTAVYVYLECLTVQMATSKLRQMVLPYGVFPPWTHEQLGAVTVEGLR
jgi:O-antigen ligase